MPEEKRKFPAELVANRPHRLQRALKRGDLVNGSINTLVKPSQFTLSREIVLRLIDWIKQI